MTAAARPDGRRVTIDVPATSANLGPGFDCLGVALELRDTLVADLRPGPLEVLVEGEGAALLPCDERHLVVRALQAGLDELGVPMPGLELRCHNRIPQSRGLGSSSAAIVAGLALARAVAEPVLDARVDDQVLLTVANRLEGHPDNVAPALLGGLVVSGQAHDDVWARRASIDPGLAVSVYVPPTALSTHAARGLLPAEVPYDAAAANTARAALLVVALAGAPELLLRATEDYLHQEQRRPAMPDSLALVDALRGAGVPASVSGAGPTVLAWRRSGTGAGTGAGGPSGASFPAPLPAPEGWVRHDLAVSEAGVRVRD